MPTEEFLFEFEELKRQVEDLRFILARKTGIGSADIKANVIAPSTVAGATVAANSITQAKMAANAIGKAEWKSEIVTLVFGSGDTSKTATITSGSIIIGIYSSTVTGAPVYGELQLSISGTTLTGTRSASPGGSAAITYTVVLLKS